MDDRDPTAETGAITRALSQPLSRRVVLRRGGLVLAASLPTAAWLAACGSSSAPTGQRPTGGAPVDDSPPVPTQPVGFLTDAQLATLRAATDRFIPGPPEDPSPGAVQAGCAEALSLFLGAFLTDPPFIYAGGPFSDRGGAADNDFVEFIELDAYERTAWRLLIEGSQGDPALEFNGPVVGAQAIYLDGLARLDERAGGDFASAPAAQRDQILGDTSDATVQAFVDIAYPDTLEAMYGPPEYGGNAGLVGWTSNDFDGDVHPRGYTDDQVVNADNPGVFDSLLPPSYGGGATDGARRSPSAPMPPAAPLAAAIASDQLAASMASANGSRRALRDALAPWLASGSMGGRHG